VGILIRRRPDDTWLSVARRTWRGYRYPLPSLRTSAAQRHPPTVYFCSPDYDVPTGGIRVMYRHVDLLNAAGIPAAVLHARSEFRCTWFENQTRVAAAGRAMIGPDDLVVVGELATGLLNELPRGFPFVVLNQNPHLTWRGVADGAVRRYVESPDLRAILTVSAHSRAMLQHAFPGTSVLRLHNSVDPNVFFPGRTDRERRIAYMPRRGLDESRQVLGIMRGRGGLDGWEVVEITRLTEREVGDRLRTAMVFLSFAYQEGFGLPAAEAMACGSYVVGFHGFSGREFFRPQFSSPVEPGDVTGFARTLERVLALESAAPGWCGRRGAAAADFIHAEYSPEREREDVVATYGALRQGSLPATGAAATMPAAEPGGSPAVPSLV
jgi:hypothetical protein